MYKIALCDDESGMRFQIAEHLREYYENIFEINEYADGEDLLTDICNEKYFDIIFFIDRCLFLSPIISFSIFCILSLIFRCCVSQSFNLCLTVEAYVE